MRPSSVLRKIGNPAAPNCWYEASQVHEFPSRTARAYAAPLPGSVTTTGPNGASPGGFGLPAGAADAGSARLSDNPAAMAAPAARKVRRDVPGSVDTCG